jgi:acyl carrier protein phosphodiesterase
MLGNFLGDFVKGADLTHLPQDIQSGIKLHRSIDSFTDHHPDIVALRQCFPASLRRMSGVVIDVYFDHLLCSHWQRFTQNSLNDVVLAFYREIQHRELAIGGRFLSVREGLLQHQWLSDYKHRQSCIRAFYQIEKRLNNRISFAKLADKFLLDMHDEFDATFTSFYPELITFSKQDSG